MRRDSYGLSLSIKPTLITSLLLRLLLGALLLFSAVLLLGPLLLLGLVLAQVLIALILLIRTAITALLPTAALLPLLALALHPPLLILLGALLRLHLGLLDLILLGLSVPRLLLIRRLKATMAVLTRRIDKPQLNLLLTRRRTRRHNRLAQRNRSLPRPRTRSLNHQKVLLHVPIPDKSAHGRNALGREVILGGAHEIGRFPGLIVGERLPNLVDLFVDLRAVMVTLLTLARNIELHACGVPRPDTRHLAQSTMRLARQTGHAPTVHHALPSVSAGDGDGVDALILGEHGRHGNVLLHQIHPERDLILNGTAVDLNLHNVRLLHLQVLEALHERVGHHAHHIAVLGDELFTAEDLGGFLAVLGLRVLLLPFRVRLLLRTRPVFVEAALVGVVHVRRPDGGDTAET